MLLEFQPADAPDPADPDVQYGLAPDQITTELLELCDQFFRQASPTVHAELRQFLTEHGYRPAAFGWFLDALGSTTLNRAVLDDNLSSATPLGIQPPILPRVYLFPIDRSDDQVCQGQETT